MLEIENLSRSYGKNTVLNDFSLNLGESEVACIVGPSGCGKSTLLRLVAGLDAPDKGRITLNNRLLSSPGWAVEAQKRRLNMVFQDYALWPHMTVAQIVGYGLRHMNRADRDRRVSTLLAQMQIAPLAERLPAQISGGQQQRVAIARALATDPDLLLLDEPLSNLDVQLRLEMRLEFAELFSRVGKTVLYVTHDPLEACSFADTLVVMNSGRIEQAGSPEQLFHQPRSAWIATLAGFDARMQGVVGICSDESAVELTISGQTLRLPRAAMCENIRPGAPVNIMAHPGSLRLGQDGLAGTVAKSLFEGRNWRVTLDLGDQRLSVMAPARRPEGERVVIGFPPGAAVVFPADEVPA